MDLIIQGGKTGQVISIGEELMPRNELIEYYGKEILCRIAWLALKVIVAVCMFYAMFILTIVLALGFAIFSPIFEMDT